MLGEHPIIAPLGVACLAAGVAIGAAVQFQFGVAIFALLDALGMIALAAHSTVEKDAM